MEGACPGAPRLLGFHEAIPTEHELRYNARIPKLGVPTIMENQMEKKMENEMETGII